MSNTTRAARLRARMKLATTWAQDARDGDSFVAAATLLKTAEALDEKLAEIELLAEAEVVQTDPSAIMAGLLDNIAALPDSARELLLAHIEGRVN